MNDDPDWISTKEAAHLLGVSRKSMRTWIDTGEIPAYRFGRVIRLKRVEVIAYIENARIVPGELAHLYPEPVRKP